MVRSANKILNLQILLPEGSTTPEGAGFFYRMNYTTIHHELRKALNISPFHYFVLDIIYNCSQEYGYCNMSRSELADKIGVSVRSCKTYFADLEAMCLIESNGNKNNKTTEIYGELVALANNGKVKELHLKVQSLHHAKSANVAPKRGKGCTFKSANVAPTPYNNKKDNKNKESAPPETDSEKSVTDHRNLVTDFKPSKEQQMYAVMAELDETHRNEKMSKAERKNLESLFHKIRKRLEEKKKTEGWDNFSVPVIEVINDFKDFCKALSPFIRAERFTCRYLNSQYGELLKENAQQGRKPASEKVQYDDDMFYKPKEKNK